MLIPRNNFDHDPLWKYTVMIREIIHSPIFVRIGSTETFRMTKHRQLRVDRFWSQAWGGSRHGGKRYKTIQDAMQAAADLKKRKYVFDARIHHVYYAEEGEQKRYLTIQE